MDDKELRAVHARWMSLPEDERERFRATAVHHGYTVRELIELGYRWSELGGARWIKDLGRVGAATLFPPLGTEAR